MKKISLALTTTLFIFFFSNQLSAQESGTIQKHSQYRLQENGWIKILEQYEETGYNETHKMDIWSLHVKIMFLQYCKASTLKSPLPDANDRTASDTDIAKALGEYSKNIGLYILPMFRCDYRTTVCLSLVSADGVERPTNKYLPVAQNGKLEMLPGETMWVTIPIPLIALDGSKPKSWQVWVPK